MIGYHAQSGLPKEVLEKLYKMADLDRDGELDFAEFVIITHILFTCRQGVPLPQKLPASLIPPSKANLVNDAPEEEEEEEEKEEEEEEEEKPAGDAFDFDFGDAPASPKPMPEPEEEEEEKESEEESEEEEKPAPMMPPRPGMMPPRPGMMPPRPGMMPPRPQQPQQPQQPQDGKDPFATTPQQRMFYQNLFVQLVSSSMNMIRIIINDNNQ